MRTLLTGGLAAALVAGAVTAAGTADAASGPAGCNAPTTAGRSTSTTSWWR